MNRKIISLILTLLLLYTPLAVCSAPYAPAEEANIYEAFAYSPVKAVFTSSTNTNQLNQILTFGRSLIGSTAYNGLCQRFVRLCYEAAGIYAKKPALTALEAWGLWGISTRTDNIPVGACVYFQGYGYDWTYGHVAIYIGNGYVLDATYNYGVSERYVTNWTGCLGWGYQGGIAPTGSLIENTTQAPSTTTAPTTTQVPTTTQAHTTPSETSSTQESNLPDTEAATQASTEWNEAPEISDESMLMMRNYLISLLRKVIETINLYLRGENS